MPERVPTARAVPPRSSDIWPLRSVSQFSRGDFTPAQGTNLLSGIDFLLRKPSGWLSGIYNVIELPISANDAKKIAETNRGNWKNRREKACRGAETRLTPAS